MKQLYTADEARRWRRRTRVSMTVCAVLSAAALFVCILLCTRVTTANARQLLLTNVALFTLAGWTDILVLYCIHAPAKALATHMESMLAEERQVHEGVYTLKPGTFHIPGSVTVRSVSLMTEEGPVSLNLSAALVRQLPPDGTNLRVQTVRRFIIAYEVIA